MERTVLIRLAASPLRLITLLFCLILLSFKTNAATPIAYDVARTATVAYNSIAASGSSVVSWRSGQNTDDNLSNIVPIGFNFNYLGTSYSSVLISTNGFITFNVTTLATGSVANSYGYANSALSNAGTQTTLVAAPFYDDLVCQGNPQTQVSLNNSVHYALNGTSPNRIFTVEWSNMAISSNSSVNLNFQIKLYESNSGIDMNYGTMEGFNGTYNTIFSYSCGLNSASSNFAFLNQLKENTRSFGTTASASLNPVPSCNSQLHFIANTPYVVSAINTVIPVNDQPANSIHLNVNAAPCTDLCGTYYTSENATSTSNVPACDGVPDDDVWFNFTATTTTPSIKVAGSGNYNAVIEVLNSSFTSLGCTNLSQLGMYEISTPSNIVTGQTYYIRVYDYSVGSGASGQFSICVSSASVPPVNDSCGAATTLSVANISTSITGSSTISATPSPSYSGCALAGLNPDDDVWYSFTALKSSETITVTGQFGFDPAIQLLGGTCASLSPVSCANSTGTGQADSLTANNLVPGTKYLIRMFHAGTGGGSGKYTIGVRTPQLPCPQLVSPVSPTSNVPLGGINLTWNSVAGATSYKVLLDTVNPPRKILSTTTATSVSSGPLEAGLSYYWTVLAGDAGGYTSACTPNSFASVPLSFALKIKVYLEGFYQTTTNQLAANLNPQDTLADSITVNLYNSSNQLKYTTKSVLSINGLADAYFPQPALQNDYYIQIKHRNSLTIWSSTLFSFNDADTLYDFSSTSSKTYGNNSVLVSPGIYAMPFGDINQDGVINTGDFNLEESATTHLYAGYYKEDLNGDRIVESTDYSMIENKFNLGVIQKSPFIQP